MVNITFSVSWLTNYIVQHHSLTCSGRELNAERCDLGYNVKSLHVVREVHVGITCKSHEDILACS